MWDYQALGSHVRELKLFTGRLVGAGAGAPAPTTAVPDSAATQVKVVRNGTGNCTYTLLDTPVGVLQSYDFWVVGTNTGATQKFATLAPMAAGSYAFTVVTSYQNGVAVDLTSSEEIHFMVVSGHTKP